MGHGQGGLWRQRFCRLAGQAHGQQPSHKVPPGQFSGNPGGVRKNRGADLYRGVTRLQYTEVAANLTPSGEFAPDI